MKDSRIWTVVEELEELDKQPDLPEGLWHITRETGLFLNQLLRHSGAQHVLEIGTSSGYSGLFMADALRENGGELVTCEASEFKIELAKQTFEKSGLQEFVTIMEGNALETLDSVEGPFDVVFIDGMKDEYVFYLTTIWSKIRVGGLVIADNMLSHEGVLGIEAYRGLIAIMDDASSVTLPIGSGLEFTCKIAES